MTEDIYTFITGASGLSFIVIGAGFIVEPGRERVRRAFGSLFLALGLVYILSWFSVYNRLPLVLDNFLLLAIVYTISQSLFEMSLFIFGGEAVIGSRRKVYALGALWSLALWLMPLLDLIPGASVLVSSVEDGRSMGLFQTLGSVGVYVWPLVITIVSFRAGRRHPVDLPVHPGVTWTFLGAFLAVIGVLLFIGMSFVSSSASGYRAGHMVLQSMMFVWYLYYRSRPDSFSQARGEIERRHDQRKMPSHAETAIIEERIHRVLETGTLLSFTDLSLGVLAKKIHVPAYKLSGYFNGKLGLSFPAWLNTVRIDHVCTMLIEQPDRTILDIAMESGYSSKTVFNAQFRKLVGMSPTGYREKNRR